MPRFKVTGTHADTGAPFSDIVEAGNSVLARKRAYDLGIRVDKVELLDVNEITADRPVPNYTFLGGVASTLIGLGILAMCSSPLILGIMLMSGSGMAGLVIPLSIFLHGAVMLAVGEVLNAIRDTAINSWHLRYGTRGGKASGSDTP
ncbi:MAG: hypothetical protein WD534_17555 [Phycisphaeraceae bacterium]